MTVIYSCQVGLIFSVDLNINIDSVLIVQLEKRPGLNKIF